MANYDSAFKTIDDLVNSPWNFSDHPHSNPTDKQVIFAKSALSSFQLAGFSEPHIMLLDDGNYGAYWRPENGNYISVDFDVEEESVMWVVVEDNKIKSGEFLITEEIPLGLRKAMAIL